MKVNKTKQVLKSINSVLETYEQDEIKFLLKDSLRNNRVLTVNQLIRFLVSQHSPILATKVATLYSAVKPYIKADRSFINRTDAVDINEFVRAVNYASFADKKFNKSVGQLLK